MPSNETSFRLFGGSYFDFADPENSQFTIYDIAHSLSQTCRFGGQCPKFYSVAQHCCLVSRLVPEYAQLDGLLHDAAEAFLGDVVKPLKNLLPDFLRIEKRVEQVVAQKFNLNYPWSIEVKEADELLLKWELRDLFGLSDSFYEMPYWKLSAVQHKGYMQSLNKKIIPWTPKKSAETFLYLFNTFSERKPAS